MSVVANSPKSEVRVLLKHFLNNDILFVDHYHVRSSDIYFVVVCHYYNGDLKLNNHQFISWIDEQQTHTCNLNHK